MRIDPTANALLLRPSAEPAKPFDSSTEGRSLVPDAAEVVRVSDSAASTTSTSDPGDSIAAYEAAARSTAIEAARMRSQSLSVESQAAVSETGAAPSIGNVVDIAAAQATVADAPNPRVEALRVLVEKLTGRRMRVIRPSNLVAVGRTDEAKAAMRAAQKRAAAELEAVRLAPTPAEPSRDEALRLKVSTSSRNEDGSRTTTEGDVSVTRRFVETQGIRPGAIRDGRVEGEIDLPGSSRANPEPLRATLDATSDSRVRILTSSTGGEPESFELGTEVAASAAPGAYASQAAVVPFLRSRA
jgi:hypothetical protein